MDHMRHSDKEDEIMSQAIPMFLFYRAVTMDAPTNPVGCDSNSTAICTQLSSQTMAFTITLIIGVLVAVVVCTMVWRIFKEGKKHEN